MSELKTVRGMRDFLPKEAHVMRRIEGKAREVAKLYGYNEIITPIVESYELLSAKAGEEVRSRMFAFKDLGDRKVALRPEFTASVARLVATALRNEPRPFRLFAVGSVYRYDEPQKGRYREFWQSNYELMGSNTPEADAEILLLTDDLMQRTGVKDYSFKVGHVGILRGMFSEESLDEKVQNTAMQLMDKKQYDDAFKTIKHAGTSADCLTVLQKLVDLKGTNIDNVLEQAKETVRTHKNAEAAVDNLKGILAIVNESGCTVNITVDLGFARGLEYYTGMIFEVYVPSLDIALGGGGRYNRLIELFGGTPTPAVGVAHGIDRMLLTLGEQKAQLKNDYTSKVIVIPINQELKGEAMKISQMLRKADISVTVEIMGRKMAKALEDADRRGIDYAVIIGERELKDESVVLRNLKDRQQKILKIEKLVETIGN